jgi:hypothetical protein
MSHYKQAILLLLSAQAADAPCRTLRRYTQLLAAAQQIPKTMPTLQRMLNTTRQLQLNNTPALRTASSDTPAATPCCCYSNTRHTSHKHSV